jgi:hypothetical protein
MANLVEKFANWRNSRSAKLQKVWMIDVIHILSFCLSLACMNLCQNATYLDRQCKGHFLGITPIALIWILAPSFIGFASSIKYLEKDR